MQCLDRHLGTKGDDVAILWEGDEPGDVKSYTFRDVLHEVCRIANVLKAYAPLIPPRSTGAHKTSTRLPITYRLAPADSCSLGTPHATWSRGDVGGVHSDVWGEHEEVTSRALMCGASTRERDPAWPDLTALTADLCTHHPSPLIMRSSAQGRPVTIVWLATTLPTLPQARRA